MSEKNGSTRKGKDCRTDSVREYWARGTAICDFGETTVAYGSVIVTEGNVECPDILKDLSVLLIYLSIFQGSSRVCMGASG